MTVYEHLISLQTERNDYTLTHTHAFSTLQLLYMWRTFQQGRKKEENISVIYL